MSPWIKRWRDWAMHDLWPMHRIGPQPQALHFSFEKAGLTLHDQPIPWNAEAVLVEASLCLPSSAPRRKTDFQLRIAQQEPIAPESLRRDESVDRHRLFFRFTPPARSTTAELVYKDHPLGQLTLPVVSREEFISHIRLQMPTIYVRIGEQSVACQSFVATQCRGLLASAVIAGPASLVPLLDLGLHVEFRSERGGQGYTVPVQMASSQLAGKQAVLTIAPRKFPRHIGAWSVSWILGDRTLHTQTLRGISQRAFKRSLRVSDTRFVLQDHQNRVTLARHVPPLQNIAGVGPCFFVSSREPGMAGLCALQVRTQVPGTIRPPLLVEQEVLITDGPTIFAPGIVDKADLAQVHAFELRAKGGSLGMLSLSPAPAASFNSEGAFKPADEFPWSAAAEDELTDRLTRLLDSRSIGS